MEAPNGLRYAILKIVRGLIACASWRFSQSPQNEGIPNIGAGVGLQNQFNNGSIPFSFSTSGAVDKGYFG